MTLDAIIFLLLAYLCGSVPVGLLAGKMVKGREFDIREYGSGNIGASNVWRTLGRVCGSVVFLIDVVKGVLPVAAAHLRTDWQHSMPAVAIWMPVFAGLASILGHNFSPFLGFKGGKGVATSLGVAFGMSPTAGAIGLGIWVVLLLVTRYISLASVIAVPSCCVFIWWFNHKQFPYIPFGILASTFAIVRHIANMKRLKNGTEPKVIFPWNNKADDDGSSGDSHATSATG